MTSPVEGFRVSMLMFCSPCVSEIDGSALNDHFYLTGRKQMMRFDIFFLVFKDDPFFVDSLIDHASD